MQAKPKEADEAAAGDTMPAEPKESQPDAEKAETAGRTLH